MVLRCFVMCGRPDRKKVRVVAFDGVLFSLVKAQCKPRLSVLRLPSPVSTPQPGGLSLWRSRVFLINIMD